MSEIWRTIPGYEGYYEVSDHGRVRSLDRNVYAGNGSNRVAPGRILRQSKAGLYLGVHLSRDGRPRLHAVHVIVAKVFLGRSNLDVLHNNGDYVDNRLHNLRYGTKSENSFDSIAHGRHFNASKSECKYGHPYTPENTYLRPDGRGRACRTCRTRDQINRKNREGSTAA